MPNYRVRPGYLLAGLGLGGAWLLLRVGQQLRNQAVHRAGLGVGLASLGIFILMLGIDAVRRGKLGFEPRNPSTFGRREFYTGSAARLWGAMIIAFSLLLFLFAGITWFSADASAGVWSLLLGQPRGWGLTLLVIGLPIALAGFIRLRTGSAGYYDGVANTVLRVSGVLPLMLGSILIAIALALLLAPGPALQLTGAAYEAVVQRVLH